MSIPYVAVLPDGEIVQVFEREFPFRYHNTTIHQALCGWFVRDVEGKDLALRGSFQDAMDMAWHWKEHLLATVEEPPSVVREGSLSDVHSWMMDAKCCLLGRGPVSSEEDPEQVRIVAPEEDQALVAAVQEKFNVALRALEDLDSTFHNAFDCR